MSNFNDQLLLAAKNFDKAVDQIYPLSAIKTVPHQVPASSKSGLGVDRYRIGSQLLDRIISISQSINKLASFSAKVELKAVQEHSQSISASLRMLIESCNLFYYLAIEPPDQDEVEIRWIYYSLASVVKYRKLLANDPSAASETKTFLKLDTTIKDYKKFLSNAGVSQWPPFTKLSNVKRPGKSTSLQGEFLAGLTQQDYLKEDFERALSKRLNAREIKQFKQFGNAAVHSSGILLIHRKLSGTGGTPFFDTATSLYLEHASRLLALTGLEIIYCFNELDALIDKDTKRDWHERARSVKKPRYLYD